MLRIGFSPYSAAPGWDGNESNKIPSVPGNRRGLLARTHPEGTLVLYRMASYKRGSYHKAISLLAERVTG